LRQLRQRSADAHAVIPSHAEIQEAVKERIDCERRLQRLTDHPHNGGFNIGRTTPVS